MKAKTCALEYLKRMKTHVTGWEKIFAHNC